MLKMSDKNIKYYSNDLKCVHIQKVFTIKYKNNNVILIYVSKQNHNIDLFKVLIFISHKMPDRKLFIISMICAYTCL